MLFSIQVWPSVWYVYGALVYATQVFDEMPNRDVFSLTITIVSRMHSYAFYCGKKSPCGLTEALPFGL